MERNAINEALLNALVDRSLNDIEHDPHRSIRKIADLGAHLAHGRFSGIFCHLPALCSRTIPAPIIAFAKTLCVPHGGMR